MQLPFAGVPRQHLGRSVLCAALALIVFAVDTATPRDIAFASLYTLVVVLIMQIGPRRLIVPSGWACAILTLVSFPLSKTGDYSSGIANTAISLVAIFGTTYLATKIAAADQLARDLQTALAEASKLAILGEFSAAISHEVSQPLAGIAANANAALRWQNAVPPNAAEAVAALKRVVSDAERAGQVLDRVRRLAKRQAGETVDIDVGKLVDETVELLRVEASRAHVELRTRMLNLGATLVGDPVEVQQILLNVGNNAIQASAVGRHHGGVVLIEGRATGGDRITLEISDDGPGLSPLEQQHLFEPFFTKKPEGLGLGLAISRTIAHRMGGDITLQGRPELGTIATIELPRVGMPKTDG